MKTFFFTLVLSFHFALSLIAEEVAMSMPDCTPPPPLAPMSLRVATWNVENLFDTSDDPEASGDDEFTPSAWRRWTNERYQLKSLHLAETIAAMRPDILFLEEIENRVVLTNLVRVLNSLPEPYPMPHIAHVESPSTRGIDVAILSRYPLKTKKLHMPVEEMRGILEAQADIDGETIVLLACHWKSWVGNAEENKAIRQKEAEFVRTRADSLLRKNPDLTLFIAGDFNDDCDGESIQNGLLTVVNREALNTVLEGKYPFYHLVGEQPLESRGSFYYARRKVWNTFDGVVIPPTMLRPLDQKGPTWRLSQSEPHVGVYRPKDGTDNEGRPKPFRRVRKKDGTDEYMLGCSDHFPFWADFCRISKNENL